MNENISRICAVFKKWQQEIYAFAILLVFKSQTESYDFNHIKQSYEV